MVIQFLKIVLPIVLGGIIELKNKINKYIINRIFKLPVIQFKLPGNTILK